MGIGLGSMVIPVGSTITWSARFGVYMALFGGILGILWCFTSWIKLLVKNKNSNNQGPKLSENSREDDATSHFSW